jgi:hypothetical protein
LCFAWKYGRTDRGEKVTVNLVAGTTSMNVETEINEGMYVGINVTVHYTDK